MNLFKTCPAILAALLATNAHADINANNGFYLGGQFGLVNYSDVEGESFNASLSHIAPFYLRPYAGYRFSDFLAIEGGYTNIENSSFPGDNTLGPDHFKLYNIDLAAKVIKPFSNGFSLFGKLGGAITHQDVFNQMFANNPNSITADTNQTVLQPLLGVGVSFNFTKNIAADLSYTYLFKIDQVKPIQTLGLGLSYTFGG